MKCKNCGNEVQETWKMCPFCGSQIEKKKLCSKCGAELQPNWAMCPFCGEGVSASIEPLTPTFGSFDVLPSEEKTTSILPSADDILPTDFDLDLVAGDIAEAKERQQEQQNAEYNKKLNLARIACIREQYLQAQQIYDDLATDDPMDINAYIGYVRIESQNYTQFQGTKIEKAIRVVEQIGCDTDENKLDKEYRSYLAKRKLELVRLAIEEEERKKQEAERKVKLEAERKAREEAKLEAERKAKLEAERKAKEEAERKAKLEAERKAKLEAERKAKLEAERKAREEAERKTQSEERYRKGMAFYDKGDHAAALPYLIVAAELGHAKAQFFAGYCYFERQDHANCVKWIKKAVDQGDETAKDFVEVVGLKL